MIDYIKIKWTQFWNIITGKDKNWDGSVDIKDKMMEAEEKLKQKAKRGLASFRANMIRDDKFIKDLKKMSWLLDGVIKQNSRDF